MQLPIIQDPDQNFMLMQTKWKSILDPQLGIASLMSPFRITGCTTAVSTTPTPLIFSNPTFNPSSNYNSNNGFFTFPTDGIYQVSCFIETASGSWSAGDRLEMYTYINGSGNSYLGRVISPTATAVMGVGGIDLLNVNAGQLLTIQVFSDVSTTVSTVPSYLNVVQLA